MTVPTDIAGLSRWYRVASLTADGLADKDPVSTWRDESGNGADLTASGSDRPHYITERWNGGPIVNFSGANHLTNGSSTGRPSTDVTVLAVLAHYKRSVFSATPQFVSWGSGGNNGWNLYGDRATDPDGMPPAMIALRGGGGTWGHNNAISATPYPGRGEIMILSGWTDGVATGIRIDGEQADDSSGDSGSINYGAGTVQLMLGDLGPGSGPLQGAILEIIIYDNYIGASAIADLEAYLDDTYLISQDKATWVSFFNGDPGTGNNYQVGLAWSPDAKRWKRPRFNPVLSNNAFAAWEQTLVKDSWILWDGTQYVLYYAGYNVATSAFSIGRATTPALDPPTWTRDASNPLIHSGSAGSPDELGCAFPVVVIDAAETNAAKKWKCWYSGTDAAGKSTICYAYSADGISWTKVGRVLDVGGAGTWDHNGLLCGCIWRTSPTGWYLFYGGRKNSGTPSRWQGGVATFTDPESAPYTKYVGNPTIPAGFNASAMEQALTADCTGTDVIAHVGSTAAWEEGMPIVLDCLSNTPARINRILKILSSTQIQLESISQGDYLVSDGGRIVPAIWNSIVPRGIQQIGGELVLQVVPFQPIDDVTHTGPYGVLREMSMRATLTSPTDDAVYDNVSGLFGMIDDYGEWDAESSENWTYLLLNTQAPNTPPGGVFTIPITSPVGNAVGSRS